MWGFATGRAAQWVSPLELSYSQPIFTVPCQGRRQKTLTFCGKHKVGAKVLRNFQSLKSPGGQRVNFCHTTAHKRKEQPSSVRISVPKIRRNTHEPKPFPAHSCVGCKCSMVARRQWPRFDEITRERAPKSPIPWSRSIRSVFRLTDTLTTYPPLEIPIANMIVMPPKPLRRTQFPATS